MIIEYLTKDCYKSEASSNTSDADNDESTNYDDRNDDRALKNRRNLVQNLYSCQLEL